MLTIKGIYGREMYETWYKMTVLIQSGLEPQPASQGTDDAGADGQSHAHSAIDKMEDPIKMTEQGIRDLLIQHHVCKARSLFPDWRLCG